MKKIYAIREICARGKIGLSRKTTVFASIDSFGFSTILAMLLTGFLITLTAGVLFLFLSENRINQSLFTGTAAYHAAE